MSRQAHEPLLSTLAWRAILRNFPSRKPRAETALDNGRNQVVLVLEVPIDGAGGQTTLGAHRCDGGALVPAFGRDFGGGIQDPNARQLSVGPAPATFRCPVVGHRTSVSQRVLTL